MNVSDKLLDLTVIRQLLLERVIAGQSVQLNKQLDGIAAALEKQLKGKELSEFQGRRLDKAIAELKAVISINPPDLTELSTAEAGFLRDALGAVGIEAALPPASAIDSIAKSALIQGATIGDWFSRLNESTRFDIERTIKNGVSLGLTNAQIAKSLIGVGDKGGEPIAKSRRDAMAITRTAVQTVAKDARLASLEANADIIKEVQWVSTLDSRTSDICVVRSGKLWTYPEFKPVGHSIPWNGGPPAHWNCRSTFIPVTKSFEELTGGKIKDKIEPSTRASMDGKVAGDLTFDAFLRSKPPAFADEMLGKGRAELWRSGKITLNQLLDQRGNPLTLAQLQSRYGSASMTARQAPPVVSSAGDIDNTIAAVKAFEYTPEYTSTKARLASEAKAFDEARAAFYATGKSDKQKYDVAVAAQQQYFATAKQFNALEKSERDRMLRVLALPNEMRGVPDDIIAGSYNATYRSAVTEATSIISSLVHRDIMPRGITVSGVRDSRAYYTNSDRTIHINKNTDVSTIVHEIVHDIEYSHPDISRRTKEFLLKRSNGEPLKRLKDLTGIKAFKRHEVAYEDEWKKRGGSHYMGKWYDRPSTELLTMGIERLLKDAKTFQQQDPEYFRFMLEILRRAN
jgi:SPP1 gp7 family putative phage head morphogenesis protein